MIGRALDRLIDNCIIGVGDFANKFFETYWPMTVSEHAKIAAADALAEREAAQEVWEADELFAAQERFKDNSRRDFLGPYVARPFEDTDDFAEPLGEYPDVTPFSPPGSSVPVEGLADTALDELVQAIDNPEVFTDEMSVQIFWERGRAHWEA